MKKVKADIACVVCLYKKMYLFIKGFVALTRLFRLLFKTFFDSF